MIRSKQEYKILKDLFEDLRVKDYKKLKIVTLIFLFLDLIILLINSFVSCYLLPSLDSLTFDTKGPFSVNHLTINDLFKSLSKNSVLTAFKQLAIILRYLMFVSKTAYYGVVLVSFSQKIINKIVKYSKSQVSPLRDLSNPRNYINDLRDMLNELDTVCEYVTLFLSRRRFYNYSFHIVLIFFAVFTLSNYYSRPQNLVLFTIIIITSYSCFYLANRLYWYFRNISKNRARTYKKVKTSLYDRLEDFIIGYKDSLKSNSLSFYQDTFETNVKEFDNSLRAVRQSLLSFLVISQICLSLNVIISSFLDLITTRTAIFNHVNSKNYLLFTKFITSLVMELLASCLNCQNHISHSSLTKAIDYLIKYNSFKITLEKNNLKELPVNQDLYKTQLDLNRSFKIKEETTGIEISSTDKISIVGPSGAGKSTFVESFKKFNHHYRFKIIFNDSNEVIDLDPSDVKIISGYIEKPLIADYMAINDLITRKIISLEDIIKISEKEQLAVKTSNNQIESLMTLARIDFPLNKRFNQYSTGQIQRINIARSLFDTKEAILIFDEPVSNIDDTNALAITRAILKQYRDHTIIFISHNLKISQIFKKFFYIDNQKITPIDSIEELLKINK